MTDLDRYRDPTCETCNQQGPEISERQDFLRLRRAIHDLLWALTLPIIHTVARWFARQENND